MIRRGTFHKVTELETAIYEWLAAWNAYPKPFTWTASADVIIEKVRRCKESVGTPHQDIDSPAALVMSRRVSVWTHISRLRGQS